MRYFIIIFLLNTLKDGSKDTVINGQNDKVFKIKNTITVDTIFVNNLIDEKKTRDRAYSLYYFSKTQIGNKYTNRIDSTRTGTITNIKLDSIK